MSLDKQRILSELGSVVNQLQNADCGCMGKMFSNAGHGHGHGGCAPMGSPLPTCGGCRRGLCPGHGYGVYNNQMSGARDPYSMNAGGMGRENMYNVEEMSRGMNYGMKRGMTNGLQGMGAGGMGGMHHGGMQGMGASGMSGMHHGGMEDMGAGGMSGMHHGGMQGMGASDMSGMDHGGMPDMGGGGMSGMDHGSTCMGAMGRKAPILYANTYNYLNKNLMQPAIKEVYDDLRTITPENTIGCNPLAAKMGLPVAGGNQMSQGDAVSGAGTMGGHMANPMQMGGSNPNGMGGMGAQIMNMMMSGGNGPPNVQQGGQLKEPMLIDAPHSPHGQVGVTPINPQTGNMEMNMNAGGMTQSQNAGMPASNQGNPAAMMQNPVTQYVTQDNMYSSIPSPQGNTMSASMPQNTMNSNPAMKQMGNANPTAQQQQQQIYTAQNPYGQHNLGMQKFHEMFPGTNQGGQLDFDPMAIAVQMNPANQKRAAIDQITKLMSGNRASAMMQPAIDGSNAVTNALGQNNPQNSQQITSQPGQQYATPIQGGQQIIQGQQPISTTGTALPTNQQQIYTTLTQPGAPAMNQQIPQQGQIDPNTGAPVITNYPGAEDPNNVQMQQQPGSNAPTQEPIYPVDNSRNVAAYNAIPQYHYNTLGQPVEMLPGSIYQKPQPGLPQTLGGTYYGNEYNVKNTMSKTALSQNIPLGTTASRSQLQHIYRQYKASHSATQQNIRPSAPVNRGSASDGTLYKPHTVNHDINLKPNMNTSPQTQQIPVENVGGDSIANNQMNYQQQGKLEQVAEEAGNRPPENSLQAGDGLSPGSILQKKGRNGLQDMTFTPYRSSTWSFHG